MSTHHKIFSRTLFFLILMGLENAIASPPFISDSPEPTEYKHLELYFFGTLDNTNDGTALQLPALEADWGFEQNWQLHVIVPANVNMPQNDASTFGQGDVETSIMFRFLQETEHCPQMAIAPALEWAIGSADKGLGNGQTWAKIPLWMQKSWGSWTSYGGGGYAFNSAPGMQNYPFIGWVVQHAVSNKLMLGSELFSQGSDSVDGKSYLLLNLGGSYNLSEHFNILVSLGHSIAGEQHLISYVGIHWTS